MSAPSNIVVVTGTDTEIGKTLVASAVARWLADEETDVRAIKPVESGIEELEPDERDGVKLAAAARQDQPREALTELGRPLAPPEAARIDGVELEMEQWCRRVERYAAESDVTIVEGAGGLLSPLTWSGATRELAVRLGAPALVVAPNTLGVLNHTLMTLEVLEQAGVPTLGVVLNACRERDESVEHNASTLRRVADIDRVATVPTLESWRAAVEHVEAPAGWVAEVAP